MKSLLKRVLGGLKCAAAVLPFVVALGGDATFIWLACHGKNTYDAGIREAYESPAVQEVIDHDIGILKEQVDNNQITVQEYQEKMKYWDSKNNLIYLLKQDKEANKEYIDKIEKGDNMFLGGIFASIGWGIISTAIAWAYANEFFFDVIESGLENFKEAKEIKEEKRKKEEFDEYKEELQ